MNDLEEIFEANTENRISKWQHYFEIYDRHFSRFRNRPMCVVEIGVQHGGSARMWREYFGPMARIVGVDKDPRCSEVADKQIEIFIGDQEDRSFLKRLAEIIPKIDILIDDGGHTMTQQINTFEILFPKVADGGVYLVEDLHTSYWPKWGGGLKKEDSFIEYSKNLIDYINAWHIDEMEVSDFTTSANSLHYYDSILVIEKKKRKGCKPCTVSTGKKMFKAG